MKKAIAAAVACLLALALTACSGPRQQAGAVPEQQPSPSQQAQGGDGEAQTAAVLIAYFTRLDNTDATLDEIVQGGGPYGALGETFESADVDAITSASITVVDGKAQGNVETMAQMIGAVTGGTLFSIQTMEPYPVTYDELIDLGGDEKREGARPALSSYVENMADYDVIFLGYPNWWYDMPMTVYSFLEEYDLSGKTVIPFAASAGSGFSNTVAAIALLQPDATVVENGLHIPMREVVNGQAQIEEWISGLGIVD